MVEKARAGETAVSGCFLRGMTARQAGLLGPRIRYGQRRGQRERTGRGEKERHFR